jgi:hypothetical protein
MTHFLVASKVSYGTFFIGCLVHYRNYGVLHFLVGMDSDVWRSELSVFVFG